MRVFLIEDTRDTPQTIKTRRGRLAKVLKGYRSVRKSMDQTVGQMRKAGREAEPHVDVYVKKGKLHSKVDAPGRKAFNRLTTLDQRHRAMRKRSEKVLAGWHKRAQGFKMKTSQARGATDASKGLYKYYRKPSLKSRASLDSPVRPANPKTYGRGKRGYHPEKIGPQYPVYRSKPKKIWRDAP